MRAFRERLTRLISSTVVPIAALACGADEPAAPRVTSTLSSSSPEVACLDFVWAHQSRDSDRDFDRRNDALGDMQRSVSCDLLTTASAFHEGIRDIKAGVANPDDRVGAQISIPFHFTDPCGRALAIQTIQALESRWGEVFTPRVVRRIETFETSELALIKSEGGFLDHGAIWFVVNEVGDPPRLSVIRRHLLEPEACDASTNGG